MLPADTTRRAARPGIAPAPRPLQQSRAEPRSGAVRHVLMTADAVGGVWRYTLDLGSALAARGIRTTALVMGPPPDPDARRDAERAGVTVLDAPYRLEWMEEPWDDVERAGEWLVGMERALQPDVVHVNGYAHAALPWSAPVIVVAHSCVRTWWRAVKGEEAPPRLDRYRRAVASGLSAACMVIAPTAAMLEALEREYEVRVHGRVIPNGRPAAPPQARPPKEHLVLAAGRAWDDAKNMSALAAVAGTLPWPVYLAGEMRDPEGRERQLPSVRPLGRLPADELNGWFGRAAIYAHPAKYEPFGLAVLEAAAAGCALVLGDIPSLRENWADAALFVPPDDHAALSAALQSLIGDARRRERLAAAASARAAAFDIARTADAYLAAYEDLIT